MNLIEHVVIEVIGEPRIQTIDLKDKSTVYHAIQKVRENCYGRESISKVSKFGDTKEEVLDKISEVEKGYIYLA